MRYAAAGARINIAARITNPAAASIPEGGASRRKTEIPPSARHRAVKRKWPINKRPRTTGKCNMIGKAVKRNSPGKGWRNPTEAWREDGSKPKRIRAPRYYPFKGPG